MSLSRAGLSHFAAPLRRYWVRVKAAHHDMEGRSGH